MNEEDRTYEELMIGHLLRRRKELSNIIIDSEYDINVVNSIIQEAIDIDNKLKEFYKKESRRK